MGTDGTLSVNSQTGLQKARTKTDIGIRQSAQGNISAALSRARLRVAHRDNGWVREPGTIESRSRGGTAENLRKPAMGRSPLCRRLTRTLSEVEGEAPRKNAFDFVAPRCADDLHSSNTQPNTKTQDVSTPVSSADESALDPPALNMTSRTRWAITYGETYVCLHDWGNLVAPQRSA